jgi:hypothetical protein
VTARLTRLERATRTAAYKAELAAAWAMRRCGCGGMPVGVAPGTDAQGPALVGQPGTARLVSGVPDVAWCLACQQARGWLATREAA